MAMFVLLSFDTDKEALDFVDAAQTNNVESAQVLWELKPVAIYKKPTQFCDGIHPGVRRMDMAFTKGKKYGWWVCAHCGKPRPNAGVSIKHGNLGKNLLDQYFTED
jgi:hypothetical protein